MLAVGHLFFCYESKVPAIPAIDNISIKIRRGPTLNPGAEKEEREERREETVCYTLVILVFFFFWRKLSFSR